MRGVVFDEKHIERYRAKIGRHLVCHKIERQIKWTTNKYWQP
jgi:hypothetical protein